MTKRYEIVEQPYGICTDPSAIKSPYGALSIANNVVIRRDGVIQPRAGIVKHQFEETPAPTEIARIVPVDDALLLVDKDTGGMVWISNPDTVVEDLSGESAIVDYKNVVTEYLNNTHYINASGGVRRIREADDVVIYDAGIVMDARIEASVVAVDTAWLANDYVVAIRVVIERRDSNGVVVSSSPSNKIFVRNTSGNLRSINYQVNIYNTERLPETYDETLVAVFYRTKQIAIAFDPGDIMYKIGEKAITWYSGGSRWRAQYTDAGVFDDNLGTELYTNSTQQGLANRNIIIPVAKSMSLFNESLFLGNCSRHTEAIFSLDIDTAMGPGESGIGTRYLEGTFTEDSPTITGISDTTGIECGQSVWLSTVTPSDTYVESKTANTITMSKDALKNAVDTFIVTDVIVWDIGSGQCIREVGATYFNGEYGYISSDDVVIDILENIYNEDITKLKISFSVRPADALLTIKVWATNGGLYTPTLNGPTLVGGVITYDEGDAYNGIIENGGNYIYWSKAYQPEHFTLGNRSQVGNSTNIVRNVPLRDLLLIFKEDGLYGVRGYNADSGFTIHSIDTDLKLLAHDAVCVANGMAYAITRRGFVSIDSSGSVYDLSRLLFHDRVRSLLNDSTLDMLKTWCSYDPYYQDVFFSISNGSDYLLFVYNTIAQRFTTWDADDINYLCAGTTDGDESVLYGCGEVITDWPLWYVPRDSSGYSGGALLYDLDNPFWLWGETATRSVTFLSNGTIPTSDDQLVVDGTCYDIGSATETEDWTGLVEPVRSGVASLDPTQFVYYDNYLYFATYSAGSYYISRIAVDSNTIDRVYTATGLTGTCRGLCVTASYLYWVDDAGKMYKCALGSSSPTLLRSTSLNLYGIAAIDTEGGSHLYTCDYTNGKVIRYDKTGSVPAGADVFTGLITPCALSNISYESGEWLYVAESTTGKIAGGNIAVGTTSYYITDLTTPIAISAYDINNVYCVSYDSGTSKWVLNLFEVGEGVVKTEIYNGFDACDSMFFYSTLATPDYTLDNVFLVADSTNNKVYALSFGADYITAVLAESFEDSYFSDFEITRPFDCSIRWRPHYGDTRALRKHFYAGGFVFENRDGLTECSLRLLPTDSLAESDILDNTFRFIVATSAARELAIEPEISIRDGAGCDWELIGFFVEYSVQLPKGIRK